jgi:hypothetical protein
MKRGPSRTLPSNVKVRCMAKVSRQETDEESGFSDSAGDCKRCRMYGGKLG